MKRKMKKASAIFVAAFSLAAITLSVASPDKYAASALEGLKLWALVVLPTLLPFFFLTALLTGTGLTGVIAAVFRKPAEKLFGADGISAYVFIMSVISGYPVGAKIICDLKEKGLITETEATKISTFPSVSS